MPIKIKLEVPHVRGQNNALTPLIHPQIQNPVQPRPRPTTEREYLTQLWKQQAAERAERAVGSRSSTRLAAKRNGTSCEGTHLNEFELGVACGLINTGGGVEKKKKREKPKKKEPPPPAPPPEKEEAPINKKQQEEEPSWDEYYARLVKFKATCGLFPLSGRLCDWLEKQKQEIQSEKLPDDQKQKLLDIGVSLDKSTEAIIDSEPIKGYWFSTEASKLFGFEKGSDVRQGLRDRIEVLQRVNKTPDGWKAVIPRDGIEDKYTEQDIMYLRHKVQYLIRSYAIVINEANVKNYGDCCEQACKELSELGLIRIGREKLRSLNQEYRQNNHFVHPEKLTVEKSNEPPKRLIFDYFPQVKDMFAEIAKNNQHQMTGKFMANEFATKILPELERKSREDKCFDDGSPGQKLLIKLLSDPPSHGTVVKWLHRLNIEWDKGCTLRGRGGTGVISNSMKVAWAEGKFANRRPKGQGLKRARVDEEEAAAEEEVDVDVNDQGDDAELISGNEAEAD